MHVPDGFIDAPVSLAAGVVAAGGVAYCIAKGSQSLDDKQVPMAGMVAAFIFAVQMLNFPVASGTSGHLLGGCLAAILVGPYLGALSVSVVLLVQALLLADGGLSALGVNVILMALVPAFVGYALFRIARQVLPKQSFGVTVASGVAAFASVVAAVGRLRRVLPARRRGLGFGRHRVGRHGRGAHAHRHRRGRHHGVHGGRGAGGAARPGLRRPRPPARARAAPGGGGVMARRRTLSIAAFIGLGLAWLWCWPSS